MKKRKNQQGTDSAPKQNPVAKYAHLFNKAQTFSDKSKYSRKAKHTRQEATPLIFLQNYWSCLLFIIRLSPI